MILFGLQGPQYGGHAQAENKNNPGIEFILEQSPSLKNKNKIKIPRENKSLNPTKNKNNKKPP